MLKLFLVLFVSLNLFGHITSFAKKTLDTEDHSATTNNQDQVWRSLSAKKKIDRDDVTKAVSKSQKIAKRAADNLKSEPLLAAYKQL